MFGARKIDGANADASGLSSSPSWRDYESSFSRLLHDADEHPRSASAAPALHGVDNMQRSLSAIDLNNNQGGGGGGGGYGYGFGGGGGGGGGLLQPQPVHSASSGNLNALYGTGGNLNGGGGLGGGLNATSSNGDPLASAFSHLGMSERNLPARSSTAPLLPRGGGAFIDPVDRANSGTPNSMTGGPGPGANVTQSQSQSQSQSSGGLNANANANANAGGGGAYGGVYGGEPSYGGYGQQSGGVGYGGGAQNAANVYGGSQHGGGNYGGGSQHQQHQHQQQQQQQQMMQQQLMQQMMMQQQQGAAGAYGVGGGGMPPGMPGMDQMAAMNGMGGPNIPNMNMNMNMNQVPPGMAGAMGVNAQQAMMSQGLAGGGMGGDGGGGGQQNMAEVYQAAYAAAFYAQQQQLQQLLRLQAQAGGGGMQNLAAVAAAMNMSNPGMNGVNGLNPLLSAQLAGMDANAGGGGFGGAGNRGAAGGMGGMGGRRGGREGGARGGLGKGGAHGSRDSLHGLNGGSGSSSSIPRTASFNGLGGQDTAQEIADMDARFGSVDECLGQIGVLARDQHGCRFLQRKFDDEGEDAVNKCYDEIIAEVVDLMMDPFGNYLVQKLLECCNDEQRTGILKAVSKIRGAEDSEPEEDDAAADAAEAAGEKKTDGDGDGDDAADEPAGSPEKPTAAEKKPPPKPAAKKTSSGSYDGEGDGVPELVSVALNTHGTRAVQKLVETLRTPEHIRLATEALKPGVVTLIKDLNGNHVIQRCLQRLEAEDNQFVYDAAKACSVEIATHRHGCCVLQRCVDHAADSQRRALVNEIAAQALVLSQDPFGNYVVQYILDLGLPWANAEVMVRLGGAYAELSMQKFSSNVVEKCLKLAGQELEEHRNVVVREIMSSPLLDRLLMDPYGNYVVQSTLTVTKGSLHAELVERIRPHLPLIKNSPFGKRILRLLLESKKN